ncbi:MAG: Ig-like domain-containing protein, partial [Desulfofundulus sp.]
GTVQDVTGQASYSVDNSGTAGVSASGLVTGKAQGSATITVTYQGKTATVPVTVTVPPATLVGVSVQPDPLVLYAGSSQRLKVTENYSDGSSIDVTSFAGFQSNDPSVAKVDSFGLVTGVKEGTTAVLVTYKGAVYTVPVTVNPVMVTGPTRPDTTNPVVVNPTRTDTGNSATITSPTRADTSNSAAVTSPTRTDANNSSATVTSPTRTDTSNTATVTSPSLPGNAVSPVISSPAPRGSAGSAVVVPSDRPQSGDVTVIGQTR